MDENLDIKFFFEKVNEDLATQNFSLAEENLKKILEIDKNNLKALFLLGSVFIQIGQLDNSIKYLEKVIEIDPNIVNAHNQMFDIVSIQVQQIIH